MTGYDIIGDVHGRATGLTALLGKLGYQRDASGVYRHPHRTAVFIGDLVDRGDGQLEVLQTVKAMVDAGSALIVMGNHEFNAVCYATRDPRLPWKFLRKHEGRKKEDHKAFLSLDKPDRKLYIKWFKTLPLWLELTGSEGQTLRVIHACWHEPSMEVVRRHCNGSNRLLTVEYFAEASRKHTELYVAIEILIKGPEISLTKYGCEPFYDDGKTMGKAARIRWWNSNARTLHDVSTDIRGMTTKDGRDYPELPDVEVDHSDVAIAYKDPVPVVFGHYWLCWTDSRKELTDYTACADFSGDDHLVAYRWDGKPTLNWENYVAVPTAWE
jgi:hypothetical protein